jgi:YegS/Rv2252/BmrU family lipid kinase
MSKLIVIYNPHSGNADLLDDIKKAFTAHGAEPEYIPITSKHLNRSLREASQKRDTTVVVAGGDGTINAAVALLHTTSCRLGIIPAGTLNHFARALGIPSDPERAIAIIQKGKQRQVDVGTVNKHVFVNNSSIGFYPHSLRTRDAYDERIGKWPAAFVGFVRAAIRPRHYRVEITIDGKQHTFRTPFVFIGNNEYKRTQPDFGERTSLDSGKLAVYIIKASTALPIIRMFAHALLTQKRHTQDFAVYLPNTCTIRTRHRRNMNVACDGEVLSLHTPLHYRSEHKSLRVIVP